MTRVWICLTDDIHMIITHALLILSAHGTYFQHGFFSNLSKEHETS